MKPASRTKEAILEAPIVDVASDWRGCSCTSESLYGVPYNLSSCDRKDPNSPQLVPLVSLTVTPARVSVFGYSGLASLALVNRTPPFDQGPAHQQATKPTASCAPTTHHPPLSAAEFATHLLITLTAHGWPLRLHCSPDSIDC